MHRISKAGRVLTLATVMVLVAALPGHEAGAQSEPGPPGDTPSFETPDGREFAPGEIIVKPSENARPGRLAEVNRANGASVEDGLGGVGARLVDLPEDLPVEQAVQRYENAPGIEYAEPDFKVYPEDVTPNDPGFDQLYGLENTGQTGGTQNADIAAPEAWETTTGDEDTIVAVIDTGVQRGHPDLKGNMWVNDDEDNDGTDNDNNGYTDDRFGWDFHNDDKSVYDSEDGDNHGTHVAGTIGAEGDNDTGVTGVNWDVEIMPLKFLGPDGGFTSDAAAAIDYAVDNGATISNNSWGGGGYSQTLQDSLDDAEQEGHLFVAAAGNASNDNDANPSYPASYENDNIISVAATDDEDQRASFSNYGKDSVDLGAPGAGILSTVPGGYDSYNGTSMASPHVAGVAALLKSANPGIGASDMKQAIMDSTDSKDNLQDETRTGGRLNAVEALGVERQADSTNLTSRVGDNVVNHGGSTSLYGRLTSGGDPVSGEKVILTKRPLGADKFRRVDDGIVTTNSNGVYRLNGEEPKKHTYYKARFPGDQGKSLKGSSSDTSVVKVRVRVPIRVATSNMEVGQKRTISGEVIPNHAGSVERVIKRNGQVIQKRQFSLDGSDYRSVYKPNRTGSYTVFTRFDGDRDHLGNRSPQKNFKVVD